MPLAYGRTLSDFLPLNDAENSLIYSCRRGKALYISDQTPTVDSKNNTIRASLLRFLLLGADENTPVHELGIRIYCGFIDGELDLSHCETRFSLKAKNCTFLSPLTLNGAQLEQLIFHLCNIHSIAAQAVKITGSLNITGCEVNQSINLMSAEITGQLNCKGSEINTANKEVNTTAFHGDGLTVAGNVVMKDGFKAYGEVRLLGANIGGQFLCEAATFENPDSKALSCDGIKIAGEVFMNNGFTAQGKVRLVGANIGGSLYIEAKFALYIDAQHLHVSKTMRLSGEKGLFKFNLLQAQVMALEDDLDVWHSESNVIGFKYQVRNDAQKIQSEVNSLNQSEVHPQKIQLQINWLNQFEFHPQPWRQLQKVLREQGHTGEAKELGIALEKARFKAGKIGQAPAEWWKIISRPYQLFSQGLHLTYGLFTAYGYRPSLLALWMLITWLLCAGIYWQAAVHFNAFAPSNPIVFQNEKYKACAPSTAEVAEPFSFFYDVSKNTEKGNWYLCSDLSAEYTGFSPLAYSLDVLLPLVDLQQQNDWATILPTPRGNFIEEVLVTWTWGHVARLVVWIETLLGWIFSLLLVAILSGLTRQNEDEK